MKVNWNLVLILSLVTILLFLFFYKRNVSCFSPSPSPIPNTIFAMNEFDWIPTPIRDVLRDGINYKIVPAMKNNLSRWWNGLSQTEKDRLINQISRYADEIEREINSATITARVTSPTP